MKSDIATALAVLNTFTGPDLSSKIRSLENAMTDLGAEDATAFLEGVMLEQETLSFKYATLPFSERDNLCCTEALPQT